MTPENLLSEWSRLLVESLADAGIHDVVISPGSRSTPLVWAFSSSARIRCRSIVDERSAAFWALGHAKATGFPSLVVCTSGSAAANYFPAIVEASLSRTPLLVLTADRPFELLDASASQTIDQTKMYGGYVRRFADLGMPDPAEPALVGLRRRVVQSVSDALGPEPGPVHLDFRARKPLEPAPAESSPARELGNRVDALLAIPATVFAAPRRLPVDALVRSVACDCRAAKRGLVVCGPSPISKTGLDDAVRRFALRSGFPVFAEATSQLKYSDALREPVLALDGLDLLLRAPSFVERFAPDVVIQIGEPLVSGAWDRFVGSHPEMSRHVVAAHGWPDPHGTARTLVIGDVEESLRSLVSELDDGGPDRNAAWRTSMAAANRAAWQAVDDVFGEAASVTEGNAVRAIVDSLPEGATVFFGNSLPVRHAEAFTRAVRSRLGVACQRGASGIDGIISAAAGTASALRRPLALVVGDLSALHDLGGFKAASSVDTPLVVVVLNNDGGRIFEQLPIAKRNIDEERLRFWTTPHGLGFRHVAELFSIPYEKPTSLVQLHEMLSESIARPGCTLVEVAVPAHGARELYETLAARVDHACRDFYR